MRNLIAGFVYRIQIPVQNQIAGTSQIPKAYDLDSQTESKYEIMFCPQCGQERTSEATSFCSRCGYLLTGTADLLRIGGASPQPSVDTRGPSPRSRGIRQGVFLFLLMFVLAPVIGLISTFGLGIEPWPVGIIVALCGGGGILRILYAVMFEAKHANALSAGANRIEFPAGDFSTSALPPQRTMSASEYASPAGTWRDPATREPTSVTDNTTKLLERDRK